MGERVGERLGHAGQISCSPDRLACSGSVCTPRAPPQVPSLETRVEARRGGGCGGRAQQSEAGASPPGPRPGGAIQESQRGSVKEGAGITALVGVPAEAGASTWVEWPPPPLTPQAAALHCWAAWSSFPQVVRRSSGERKDFLNNARGRAGVSMWSAGGGGRAQASKPPVPPPAPARGDYPSARTRVIRREPGS